MKSLLIVIVALFMFVGVANAGDWVWKDGYWWKDGKAYSAVRVRVYENGCWHWKWKYTLVNGYDENLPSYKDAAWRDKLTDIVAAQEKYEAAMKLSALEHAEWLEAMSAVGYPKKGSAYSLRYATGANFFGPSSYAAQGSSVYGSVQTQTETQNFYNPVNLDVLWNQADRHVDKAQNLSGEAVNGFRETLREASELELSAKERIAKIYAAADVVKAASTPEVRIKKETRTETYGSAEGRPNAPANTGALDVVSVIQNKCANCHNAQNPAGGFDLTKYETFSSERKGLVRTAITNPDPQHRMPLKKEGDKFVPGEPLSYEELMAFTQ